MIQKMETLICYPKHAINALKGLTRAKEATPPAAVPIGSERSQPLSTGASRHRTARKSDVITVYAVVVCSYHQTKPGLPEL